MKSIFLVLFAAILFSASGAWAGGRHYENYMIMQDTNDTVQIFGNITKDGTFVHYKDAKGKVVNMAITKIKRLVTGDDVYLTLPITTSINRLQKLIATSNDYVLTELEDNGKFLYIWDRNFVAKESKLSCANVATKTGPTKYGNKLVNETIAKYFGNCKRLMAILNDNITDDSSLLTRGISNLRCEGMPEE